MTSLGPVCHSATRPWSDLPPNVWGIISRSLPPNEVAITLRLVCKDAAVALPDEIQVRLSEPVPPHAFEQRFGSPQACHDMPLEQRQKLLELTACSGSLVNLQVAITAAGCFPAGWLVTAAAGAGHLHVCQALIDQRCPCDDKAAAKAAARGGHLDLVRWLLERVRQQQRPEALAVCGAAAWCGAAGAGHQELCEALLADGLDYTAEAPAAAARGGHVRLTEWLLRLPLPRAQGPAAVPFHPKFFHLQMLRAAAFGFDLPALQRLHRTIHQQLGWWYAQKQQQRQQQWPEADGGEPFNRWPPQQLLDADDDGRFPTYMTSYGLIVEALNGPTPDWRDKIAWLRERGVRLDQMVFTSLVSDAELYRRGDAVQRVALVAQLLAAGDNAVPGALIARLAGIKAAVYAGDLDALQALRHAFPNEVLEPCAAAIAAAEGNLALLQRLAASGWRVAWPGSLEAAARAGHLAVLRWLVGPDAGPGVEEALRGAASGLATYAARSGSVEVLEWVRSRGCAVDEATFTAAAGAGNVAALERLASWGCGMGVAGEPYIHAAANGDLATLRCLRRLGCPWDPTGDTLTQAVRWRVVRPADAGIPLAALRWLVAEGCPADWAAAARHVGRRRTDHEAGAVQDWIRENVSRQEQEEKEEDEKEQHGEKGG